MSATGTAPRVPETVVDDLVGRLTGILGEDGVRTDRRARERASLDGCTMSPVLMERQPLGLADVVALPRTSAEVPAIVAAAVALGVPVTARGRGTGNYAQAIPLHGGLVLDLSRAGTIHEVGDGWIEADAGARMVDLERAAWASDQQLWMYPSTVSSSVGGFLSGGSCGTGSLRHGNNDTGFAAALEVVTATSPPAVLRLAGEATTPYVHTYGVAGVITRATVRLEPLQPWRVLWASFPDVSDGLRVFRSIARVDPRPRLVSLDDARLVASMPADPALLHGRASLRAVVDAATLDEVRGLVESAGGRVESVREGLKAVLEASVLSYNHPTWWLMHGSPDRYVHIEAMGDVLEERHREALAVLEDSSMHFEARRDDQFVLVNGVYRGYEDVKRAMAALVDLGARVHDPHQYEVDHQVERIRELARVNDPWGLLNPGKLPPAPAEAGPA